MCDEISDRKKLILLDQPRRGRHAGYGHIYIYIYDNAKLLSYKYEGDSLAIDNDGRYDHHGKLQRFMLFIKDSTLEKLRTAESQNKPKPDATTLLVYYLDAAKNDFKMFLLY